MPSFYTYALVIFLLCSCSNQMPEPISYPHSQQKEMQAASHWDMLAADLANRINKQLILTDNHDKAVFVKETCGDENSSCQANETSTFNEAFHDLLITNLLGYGVPTKRCADKKAIEVNYKVQVVYHNTGVVANVARDGLGSSSYYEVIITTSMITGSQYLFRASDIYYINEKDFYQYQESRPQTKTIKLSSKKLPRQPDSLAQPSSFTAAPAKSGIGTTTVTGTAL